MIDQASTQEEVLAPYYPTELSVEDFEEHNKLGLPNSHPHLFAKAMLAQLARLPLIESEVDQGLFAEHTVALSA